MLTAYTKEGFLISSKILTPQISYLIEGGSLGDRVKKTVFEIEKQNGILQKGNQLKRSPSHGEQKTDNTRNLKESHGHKIETSTIIYIVLAILFIVLIVNYMNQQEIANKRLNSIMLEQLEKQTERDEEHRREQFEHKMERSEDRLDQFRRDFLETNK